jgi:ATP-dependent Lon protease
VCALFKLNKKNTLPILTVKNTVFFPGTVMPFVIGRDKSLRLIEEVVKTGSVFGIVAQKDMNQEDPQESDLYKVGTIAKVIKFSKNPEGQFNVIVEGMERFEIVNFTSEEPFYEAEVQEPSITKAEAYASTEINYLFETLRETAYDICHSLPEIPKNVLGFIDTVSDPGTLADIVAGNLGESIQEKQEVLETYDVADRIIRAMEILGRRHEMLVMSDRIQNSVKEEISKNQREYYLRQQLKAINNELGENEETNEDLNNLKEKMKTIDLPEEVLKALTKEIKKMRTMQTSQAEYNVSLNYVETILDYPWDVQTRDSLDIARVQQQLDDDHYGLQKVKERIVEYLSVRRLKDDMSGPILCLLGPPGVGKTSLGKSIAHALGRKLQRISLGGVADESEIRGHRRTYIGAMPGRIAKSLIKVGVNNPLILLDEIDKMGRDHKGDPSAAMLEVLDPEQNSTFADHYFDVPIDLSETLFIATANDISGIPGPLRDRMEIIELSGYTYDEKENIAFKHLIPKQIKKNGIEEKNLSFDSSGINKLILQYTREAGVRGLEREISKVCRKVAADVAKAQEKDPPTNVSRIVSENNLEDFSGPTKFDTKVDARARNPGVATGMAWTAAGGDVLYIEASKMAGKGQLVLTGKIGDVMSESCKMAVSLIRSKAHKIGISEDDKTKFLEDTDIHIHFPAGAVPKDGPSAGITISTALVSLFTGKKVRTDTAMTGETSLRGLVLPVGGIKEKVIAAHRMGIKRIILPPQNEKDMRDVPEKVKNEVEFFFPETVEEVFELALE